MQTGNWEDAAIENQDVNGQLYLVLLHFHTKYYLFFHNKISLCL